MDSMQDPLKNQGVPTHAISPRNEINDLSEVEKRTDGFSKSVFHGLDETPLSRRIDLVFVPKRQKSIEKEEVISSNKQELSFEETPLKIAEKIENQIKVESEIEKISGNSSDHRIRDLSSSPQAEKVISQGIERLKQGGSETEKLKIYGEIVGAVVESIPSQLEAIEHGGKSRCLELFSTANKLMSNFDKAKPFCTAATLIFARIADQEIKNRIEKDENLINQLKKENKKENALAIRRLELGVQQLKHSQQAFLVEVSSDDSMGLMKSSLEEAVKKLTPLLPKGENTFTRLVNFSNVTCEAIRLGCTAVVVKQRYEALQMLYLMKESLEKEKAKLELGEKSLGKEKEIQKLEKEIVEIEEQIMNGKIEFASSGIGIFENIMKGLAVVLPTGSQVFLNFASTLSLLSKGLEISMPGRSIALRIQKIREYSTKADSIALRCEQLKNEIEELQNSGKTIPLIAKRILFSGLSVRLNAIRNAWIPHEVLNLTEELISFSSSGQTISKDLLVLIGAGKAALATVGTLGVGLIVANVFAKLSKIILNEKSSFIAWKEEFQLAKEQKALRKEVCSFHTSSLSILNRFFIFKEGTKTVNKDVAEKMCKEELSGVFKEQKRLQAELLKNANNPKIAKMVKIELHQNLLLETALHEISQKISKTQETTIPVSKLSEMKQEAFAQFTVPILYEYEAMQDEVYQKKIKIRDNYEKSHKLELLGLPEEMYDGFRQDLERLLDSPRLLFELSELIRGEDEKLAEAIFGQKAVNIDLLVDYFIPPVGSKI